MEQKTTEIFRGIKDIYNGIHISTDDISWESCEEFGERLKNSVSHWKITGIRGVWIKISLKDAILVGEVAKHGFEFHHAQPLYVMMTRWLPSPCEERNMLPAFANHYIGVGGLVIDSKNQMLVIKERYTAFPLWKLPGGAVDKGESLSTAVVREVREETGVSTEFVSVICFRHMTEFRYKQSDLYFVCLLKSLTDTITYDPAEISACRWMDIDEFLSSHSVNELNKRFVQFYKDKHVSIDMSSFDVCTVFAPHSKPPCKNFCCQTC
ncbi:Nudix hydrolase 8 [Holothuria leucospilota]|uniref:Nudix hydrolase 8 n=1 Tax=Holothuria leucospilota TaxID=206669 RepID=A0A9Q1HB18_HOLLE|nr:Nudix hydrolase 8 [Holothuria leucospilota]